MNFDRNIRPPTNPPFVQKGRRTVRWMRGVVAQQTVQPNPLLSYFWVLIIVAVAFTVLRIGNTPDFGIWAALALAGCAVPVYLFRCDAASFVVLLALVHAIYYPLAVLVNLLPSTPGVYESVIWERTPSAMMLCALGMTGMGFGARLYDRLRHRSPPSVLRAAGALDHPLPTGKILLLSFVIVPYALFLVSQGIYFHSFAASDAGFSVENADRWAWVGYLEYLPYVALTLQLYRWQRQKTRENALLAFACVLIPLLTLMPSGSRDLALRGVVPIGAIFVFSYLRIPVLRATLYATLLTFATWYVVVGTDIYRNQINYNNVGIRSPVDRLSLMIESFRRATPSRDNDTIDQQLQLVGRRMADYVVPAMATAHFPAQQPYRHVEDMLGWIVYLLPNQLRPAAYAADTRDSAKLAGMVGFKGGTLDVYNSESQGSSPGMILGDWYSRFGWPGVFLGMSLLGVALRMLDHWLSERGLFGRITWALLILPAAKLSHQTLFNWLMYFTRALLITLALAWLLERYLNPKKRRLPPKSAVA